MNAPDVCLSRVWFAVPRDGFTTGSQGCCWLLVVVAPPYEMARHFPSRASHQLRGDNQMRADFGFPKYMIEDASAWGRGGQLMCCKLSAAAPLLMKLSQRETTDRHRRLAGLWKETEIARINRDAIVKGQSNLMGRAAIDLCTLNTTPSEICFWYRNAQRSRLTFLIRNRSGMVAEGFAY